MGGKYLIIKKQNQKIHKQNLNIKINIKKAKFQHKFGNLTIQERILNSRGRLTREHKPKNYWIPPQNWDDAKANSDQSPEV